jgi:hypothetical protein
LIRQAGRAILSVTNMKPILTRGWAFGLTRLLAATAPAQSSLKLSSLTPGTEWTQTVTNGDFQAQGPLVGSQHPNPTGWSGFGEMKSPFSESARGAQSDRVGN